VTRTVFFGFLNSSEHYIVEAYPPMIAACSVTVAALWKYVKRFARRDSYRIRDSAAV
jgi:hypothetical protein